MLCPKNIKLAIPREFGKYIFLIIYTGSKILEIDGEHTYGFFEFAFQFEYVMN